jgi:hypothetical protein
MNANFVIDNSKNCKKKNAHYQACRRENRPFVFISPRVKYASVELDMFPTNRNLDEPTRNKIHQHMISFGVSAKQVRSGNIFCYAHQVLKSDAKTLANDIYQIAYDAMPHLKHCSASQKL